MGYTSYVYLLVFLGATFLAYTVAPLRFKWCVLLLASAAFYVVSSRFLTVFLLAATLTVYLSGLWLGRVQRRYEQEVVSSGFSQYFPADVLIGYVESFSLADTQMA